MSEPVDLYEAILAELRQFGGALAACIVVTPVARHGSPAAVQAASRTCAPLDVRRRPTRDSQTNRIRLG